jgi:general secretion pathway protein F/type IV pilus assembly protein PilC
MPLYRYEAVDAKGKKTVGTLDAETLGDAKQKLLRRSVFFTRLIHLPPEKARPLLKKGEILNFTKELARLLKAGLPLYESLAAMEEKYKGQKAQTLLLDLAEQVKSGTALSAALARHSKIFDLLYRAMVANAEKTGRLSESLDEVAHLLAKQQHVRKQMQGALVYPALLFGFCLFVFGALLFYVVPSLQELFEGRPLHPFTQIVFAASRIAVASQPFLVAIAVCAIGLIGFLFWNPRWKAAAQIWLTGLPWLGPLFSKAALIRFSRAAATLMTGGVPIVEAFAQARATLRHPGLEQVIREVEKAVIQGERIHAAFRRHPKIPPLIPRMLGIAEESGNLSGMLQQIAEIYEEEIERALLHFTTLAQPALLLFLGAIVGFVLLSVLLPLTDVSTFST